MGGSQNHEEVAVSNAVDAAVKLWPTLPHDLVAFVEHATRHRASAEKLARHGKDLYLAFNCAKCQLSAVRVLEREFLRDAERAISRVSRNVSFVDEVRQQFRERLLLGGQPSIATYSANGPLGAWLRISVMRTALNVRKAETRRRWRSGIEVPSIDQAPPREHQSQPIIQQALNSAMARLAESERLILRLFYMERRSLDGIAELHGVHRATITRRLAESRKQIAQSVTAEVQRALSLTWKEAEREVAEACLCLEIKLA